MIPYRPLEVVELKRPFVTEDAKGTHYTFQTVWAVRDDADEEGTLFALVERAEGYKGRQMTCWCSDGRTATGNECRHERAVVEQTGPQRETGDRDAGHRVDPGVFCD